MAYIFSMENENKGNKVGKSNINNLGYKDSLTWGPTGPPPNKKAD